jgi:pimeloyl-ACP methyl ester carboxylesterase
MQKEKILNINGLNIFIRESGKGYPLFLLHGWGVDSLYFDKLENELKNDFTVIRFDWPGFGKSDKLKTPFLLSDYRKILIQIFNHYDFFHYSVLAHSFGGRVLTSAISENKLSELDNVILCACAGVKNKYNIKKIVFFVLAKCGKLIFRLPFFINLKDKACFCLYKAACCKDYYNADMVMKKTMQNIIKINLLPLFSKIDKKTLLLWGSRDTYTPLPDAKLINNKIKNSDLKIINEANHSIIKTHSKKVSKIIYQFLSQK